MLTKRRSALASVLASVAGLVLAMAASPAAGAAPDPWIVSSADPLRLWAAQYMERGIEVTKRDALNHARRFDVIFAHKDDYTPYLADMVRVKPKITVIAYYNAVFAREPELSRFQESDFAHDRDGKRIKHNSFNLWLMEPTSTRWIQSRIDRCHELLASTGYTACGIDNVGPAAVTPGYASGVAINPDTGRAYSTTEWLTTTRTIARAVRTSISPVPLYGNSLGNGEWYFRPGGTKTVLEQLDGASVEAFLRAGRDRIDAYPTTQEWKLNVEMLVDAGREGRPLMTVTKTWVDAPIEVKERWHAFSLATFMLGTNGIHKFWFTYRDTGRQTGYDPRWSTVVGRPLGAYEETPIGLYTRAFSKGRVYVNPTTTTKTVMLGDTYRTMSGERITSLVLPPHSGEVLRAVA